MITQVYTVNGRTVVVHFSLAAVWAIEDADTDVAADLEGLDTRRFCADALYEQCLDGAVSGRVRGWRDYVNALVAALDT